MDATTAEILRLIQNLIRLGTIAEVDGDRVRVKSGKNTTNWLRWLTHRAGNAATWWQPSIGEQVVILSPAGDLAAGIVLPAIYSDAHPAPDQTASVHTTHYSDGAIVQYDFATHALSATLPDGSSATVTANAVTANADIVTSNAPQTVCTGDLTVEKNLIVNGHSSLNAGMAVNGGSGGGASAVINGTLQATTDVIAANISLAHHPHGGVQRGGDQSEGPLP